MTSNTSPSGEVSASGYLVGQDRYAPYRAFDYIINGDAGGWVSTSVACWLTYDFKTLKKVAKYAMTGTDYSGRNLAYPSSWTFEGSNDNTNWVILDNRTNEVGWQLGERREYICSTSDNFRYYRLNISKNNGWATYSTIGELEMMELLVQIPSVPTNLILTPTNTAINLKWDTISDATDYDIEVDGKDIYNTTSTTYTHSNLTPNTQHTYRVRAKSATGVSDWSESKTTTTTNTITTELDIEATKYRIVPNANFEADVVIRNSSNLYAEDITIEYDANLFAYVGAAPVNVDALKIYQRDTSTSGKLRFIVASNGQQYGLNGNVPMLKLWFKANATVGEGGIKVTTGLVADGNGNETQASCLGKTFKVINGDVNGDGKFSLGDLAIAAKLISTTQDTWGTYEPDVDANGNVEIVDLQKIASSLVSVSSM